MEGSSQSGSDGSGAPRRAGGRGGAGKVSRRRQIIDGAITVFAEKGFHAARVSDIAREAGVAHGLVYHYFESKDAVLGYIFQRTWGQLSMGLQAIDAEEKTGAGKLTAVVRLILGSYRLAPDLVRVVVLEITRSGHLRKQVEEIAQAFATIESMIAEAQSTGEFRDDIPANLASYVFWGALEEVLTGWVFTTLPTGDQDVGVAERAVVEMVLGGLRAPAHA